MSEYPFLYENVDFELVNAHLRYLATNNDGIVRIEIEIFPDIFIPILKQVNVKKKPNIAVVARVSDLGRTTLKLIEKDVTYADLRIHKRRSVKKKLISQLKFVVPIEGENYPLTLIIEILKKVCVTMDKETPKYVAIGYSYGCKQTELPGTFVSTDPYWNAGNYIGEKLGWLMSKIR